MLAPKIAAAAGKTTHRFRSAVPHSVHGQIELPLGRSAHPRRVAEARYHRLRTHGVAVYPTPNEGTVAELADVPRKRVGPVGGVRLDGHVIGRAARSRCRRSPSLRSLRPAPPSRDGQSVALPGGRRLPIGSPRFTTRFLVGILPRITRTTTRPPSYCTTTRPPSYWQGSAEVGRCRNFDQTRADEGDSPSFRIDPEQRVNERSEPVRSRHSVANGSLYQSRVNIASGRLAFDLR
jgi:hypothetical protein